MAKYIKKQERVFCELVCELGLVYNKLYIKTIEASGMSSFR